MTAQRVLVTGAASDYGAAVAGQITADGASVVVADGDAAALAAVAGRIGAAGTIGADPADPEQVRRMIEEAVAVLGGIDVLVNCADGAPAAARLDDTAADD